MTPRLPTLIGLALSVVVAGLFSGVLAGTRTENATLATPVNVYGSQGVPLRQVDDAGTIGVSVTGGTVSLLVPDAQVALPVHETGYLSATASCLDVTCSTVGDGGIMGSGGTLKINQRYVSTVTTDSPVRVRPNGLACGSFTAGTGVGRILNEGSTLDFIAEATPDGGVPSFTCCAKTSGAVWQLCEHR